MKIAFVIFAGMTALDFIGVYDPLTRLKTMGFRDDLEWDICALAPEVSDFTGLRFTATRLAPPLDGYDLVILPGGPGTRALTHDPVFLAWLKTAAGSPRKASVSTGALLWAAAGFLQGRQATTHPQALPELAAYGAVAVPQRVVEAGDLVTSAGVTAALDLGLYLCAQLAGPEIGEMIRRQMDYGPAGAEVQSGTRNTPGRRAQVHRQTRETDIHLALELDGRGAHTLQTGIGFLDHMLTHLAVHGLFDLTLQAQGDLQVDPHHTVEDVALVLGQAFTEALGDRAGLVRTASAYVPLDEALAFIAVDFSGRPYAVIQADWRTPQVGGLPTSLFGHFLESFAAAARCNLHARLLYSRDDHHGAEALFKALARALDQATRVDPRRSGSIPSTKGTLL